MVQPAALPPSPGLDTLETLILDQKPATLIEAVAMLNVVLNGAALGARPDGRDYIAIESVRALLNELVLAGSPRRAADSVTDLP